VFVGLSQSHAFGFDIKKLVNELTTSDVYLLIPSPRFRLSSHEYNEDSEISESDPYTRIFEGNVFPFLFFVREFASRIPFSR